jgi:hypothetical protein
MHDPADGLLTDSACSATQLALGLPSRNEMIGVDANGVSQPNLRELAAERGMATGVVSDTRLTHATPAAFLAHVASRSDESAIAAAAVASNVDVVLSGGWREFVAEGGRRKDGRDLLVEAAAAVEAWRWRRHRGGRHGGGSAVAAAVAAAAASLAAEAAAWRKRDCGGSGSALGRAAAMRRQRRQRGVGGGGSSGSSGGSGGSGGSAAGSMASAGEGRDIVYYSG